MNPSLLALLIKHHQDAADRLRRDLPVLCYYGADHLEIEVQIFKHEQIVRELKKEYEPRDSH